MKYLFDASSILEAITKDKIEVLSANYTVELARYELGNTIWKRIRLLGKVNREEYTRLISLVKRVLKLMETLSIECHETQIAEVAAKLNITFYDAAYVFHAKQKNIPLVTEDKELKTKTATFIKTQSLKEIPS